MAACSDRTPLLQEQHRPPPYFTDGPILDVTPCTYYTETDERDRMAIYAVCHCKFKIYLGKTMDELGGVSVVKCPNCNEWAPFKAPPEGIRFVRCSCRMLIRCCNSSRKTICPSQECKKEIQLWPEEPGVEREMYQCAYCINVLVITAHRKYIRCDICGRISSVGKNHSSFKIVIFVLLGIFFSGGGIVTAVMTHEIARKDSYWEIYIAWAVSGLLGFVCFLRAGWLARIQVSYRLPNIN